MKNIKINGVVYNEVEKINVKDESDNLVQFIDTDTDSAAGSLDIVEGRTAFVNGELVEGSIIVPWMGYYHYGCNGPNDYEQLTGLDDSGIYYFDGSISFDKKTTGYYFLGSEAGDDLEELSGLDSSNYYYFDSDNNQFDILGGLDRYTSGYYYFDGYASFNDLGNVVVINSAGCYEVYYSGDVLTYNQMSGCYKIYDSEVTQLSDGQVLESTGLYAYDDDSKSNYELTYDVLYYTDYTAAHGGELDYSKNSIWSCDENGEAVDHTETMEIGDEVTITFDNGQEYKLTRIS